MAILAKKRGLRIQAPILGTLAVQEFAAWAASLPQRGCGVVREARYGKLALDSTAKEKA